MSPFFAEMVGTAILILLGNGVVANVVLKGTKGHGAGWIVITFGWGMAVFVGVFCTAVFSSRASEPGGDNRDGDWEENALEGCPIVHPGADDRRDCRSGAGVSFSIAIILMRLMIRI